MCQEASPLGAWLGDAIDELAFLSLGDHLAAPEVLHHLFDLVGNGTDGLMRLAAHKGTLMALELVEHGGLCQ